MKNDCGEAKIRFRVYETSSSLNEISEAMNCIEENAEKTKEMAAELGSTIRYFHE